MLTNRIKGDTMDIRATRNGSDYVITIGDVPGTQRIIEILGAESLCGEIGFTTHDSGCGSKSITLTTKTEATFFAALNRLLMGETMRNPSSGAEKYPWPRKKLKIVKGRPTDTDPKFWYIPGTRAVLGEEQHDAKQNNTEKKNMTTKTFAEMLECIAQHREGMLCDAELVMALQCDVYQIDSLLMYLAQPETVQRALQLTAYDADTYRNRELCRRVTVVTADPLLGEHGGEE